MVDAPAAGHAITFLLSARGLLDAVRVGPIHKQASDVVELLSDPTRCQVMLVTLPEETPVNELIDTAFAIEDRAGVALGPVVVNACFAPLPGRRRRRLPTRSRADAEALGRFVSRREADDLAHAAAFRARAPRRAARADRAPRRAAAAPADRAAVPASPPTSAAPRSTRSPTRSRAGIEAL